MTTAAWFLLAQTCFAGPKVFPTECHTVRSYGPFDSFPACREASMPLRQAWKRGAPWQRLMCERKPA